MIYDSNDYNMLASENNSLPLWRPRNYSQKHGFHINGSSSEDDDINMDAILNMNKYKCHICNIEVPKKYMIEHQNSKKHEKCKEIANMALERAKLQMDLNIPSTRIIEISETYFCDACSAVIQNSDKAMHVKSKSHKTAAKHDEMLEDLLKIYDSIENVETPNEMDELETLQMEIEAENCAKDFKDIQKKLLDKTRLAGVEIYEAVKNIMIKTIKKEFETLKGDMNDIVRDMIREDVNKHSATLHDSAFVDKGNSNANKIKDVITVKTEATQIINADKPIKIPENDFITIIDSILAKHFHIYESENKKQPYLDTSDEPHKIKEMNTREKYLPIHENVKEMDTSKPKKISPKALTVKSLENGVKDTKKKTRALHDKTNDLSVKETSTKKVTKHTEKKVQTVNDNLNEEKSQGPNIILVNYLKDISRKTQSETTHSVRALTDTTLEITALNGDKIKVLVNNFHSFHAKALNTFCKVCEMPNVGLPRWHISNGDHVAKIMTPIKDLNGIRQIDDVWSHCVVCNELTKNIEFHLQSLLHKNKVRHCLIATGNDNPNPEPTKGIKPHSLSDKFLNSMIKHNLVVTNKGELKCILCDETVSRNKKDVAHHANSFEHLKELLSIQEKNALRKTDDDKLYCNACNTKFENADLFLHCKNKKHNGKLTKFLDQQRQELEANGNELLLTSIGQKVESNAPIDSELICFVCEIVVYSVKEHTESFQHKKKYLAYLEANKINEFEAGKFICIPCNTTITLNYLMGHCQSKKHKTTINEDTQDKESKDQARSRILTQLTSIPKSTKIPIKVLYQFKETPDKLICLVCDEEILMKKDAMYHVSTLDHIVAFNLLMLWNKLKNRHDTYYCDVCRTNVTYYSEITHIFGKQHLENLSIEPKGTVYEYDRTLVTHAIAMSHRVGNRTQLKSTVTLNVKSGDCQIVPIRLSAG